MGGGAGAGAGVGTGSTGRGRGDDRFRTFRGRYGTPMAYGLALLWGGGCVFVALSATNPAADAANRIAIIVLGLFGAVVAWRFGAVRAIPDPYGLTVVNYATKRHLVWAEIVAVRFGLSDPWVHLDLTNGDVLAVMGIQRADGEHGMAEARRLVALVAELGEAEEPGRPDRPDRQ